MTRSTPRSFRMRLIRVVQRVRLELRDVTLAPSTAQVLEDCVELLEELEDPLTRFVMTSDKGMRT